MDGNNKNESPKLVFFTFLLNYVKLCVVYVAVKLHYIR